MMKTFLGRFFNNKPSDTSNQPDYYLLMANTKHNKYLENKLVKVIFDDDVEEGTSYFLRNEQKLKVLNPPNKENNNKISNDELFKLAQQRQDLTPWEDEFLISITCSVPYLTPKQYDKLYEIAIGYQK